MAKCNFLIEDSCSVRCIPEASFIHSHAVVLAISAYKVHKQLNLLSLESNYIVIIGQVTSI